MEINVVYHWAHCDFAIFYRSQYSLYLRFLKSDFAILFLPFATFIKF